MIQTSELQGTWHVLASTFPMWTKSQRRRPTFTYSNVREEQGVTRFDDCVAYAQAGKTKQIIGVDTVLAPDTFRWRGKGWLRFFTSDWGILERDVELQWLIIAFSKTLATPAGLDVICRHEALPTPLEQIIQRTKHPMRDHLVLLPR